MNNSLTSPQSPVGNIALDEHTKHLFSEEYHNGPVEKFFRPDLSGIREHIYAGREAVMLSGERVVIAQHFYLPQHKRNAPAGVIEAGAIFVASDLIYDPWSSLVVNGVTHKFWLNEVFGVSTYPAKRSHHPLPLMRPGRLVRCHKEFRSGFGLLLEYRGKCRFIDLRGEDQSAWYVMLDVDGEEPLELKNNWHTRCSQPSAWFINDPEWEFHDQIERIAEDVEGQLHQFLRFHRQSDDGRAREVFGCDMNSV